MSTSFTKSQRNNAKKKKKKRTSKFVPWLGIMECPPPFTFHGLAVILPTDQSLDIARTLTMLDVTFFKCQVILSVFNKRNFTLCISLTVQSLISLATWDDFLLLF